MKPLALWKKLHTLPCGKWLFSRALGKKIPYTGSIGSIVEELEPGYAKVSMRDRKCVRNHLRSVHAVALMNLAEFTSGLATIGALPSTLRGILVGFRIEYLKKARGKLTATSRCAVPNTTERVEHTVEVQIQNADGDTVCRAFATWLIGPA